MVTSNHGLHAPGRSVDDWDVPLNDNFEAIDRKIEIRDVRSNLGKYNPTQNAKFLATDTGEVFFGDGSQWNSQWVVGDYISVANNGSAVLSSPTEVNFGDGLAAADDGDGTVTVSASSTTDTHIDVENTDGNTLVADVSSVHAGNGLDFSDDGDGSVTIEYTGSTSGDTRVNIENQDGTTLVTDAQAIQAGAELSFSDDGDSTVTLDYVGSHPDTHADVEDIGGVVVSDPSSVAFTASSAASVSVTADGDGSATVDVSATDTDTHIDALSSDGTALASNLSAIKEGANVSMSASGGTATVNATDTDTHINVENTDGTTLVSDIAAVQAGLDLSFTDDGDGTVTLDWTGSGGNATASDSATKSGDNSTKEFSLSHSLGEVPGAAFVQATSEAASTDFWVDDSQTDSSTVTIVYDSAPPSGSSNLSYQLITHE